MKNIIEIRVYYADTDHEGVVYYANYLRWFEIGRTEILRQCGYDYSDIEKKNIIVPVVEVKCNYNDSARYNDMIIIESSIDRIGNSSMKFNYKIIRKKDEKLLAEGYTINVFVDRKTMKSIKIPEELRKALQD